MYCSWVLLRRFSRTASAATAGALSCFSLLCQGLQPRQARGGLNTTEARWCRDWSRHPEHLALCGDLEADVMANPYLSEDLKQEKGAVFFQVSGTLHGRRGSFLLQVPMGQSESCDVLLVKPNTGTGELEGITGQFESTKDGARAVYKSTYMLPVAR
ncbi:MAG: DUF3224 domain-containing protein [Janthinobacterium lividum]